MHEQKLKRRQSQDDDEISSILYQSNSHRFDSPLSRHRISPPRYSTPSSRLSRLQQHFGFEGNEVIFIVCALLYLLTVFIIIKALIGDDLPDSNSQFRLTQSISHFDAPIQSTNFDAFSIRLHAQCRYAYSHHSSDLGDVRLSINQNTDSLTSNSYDDEYGVPFLRFLTFSDYGIIHEITRNNELQEYDIQSLLDLIKTMNSHLDDAHFTVSAGDHFYDNNVDRATHPRWGVVLDHFTQNRVFLSCSGNKDWKNQSEEWDPSRVQAQIDRTQWSRNWCLPKLYYTVRFVFIDEETQSVSFTVRLIALDTTSFQRRTLNSNHFQYLEQQYQWLQNVLTENQEDDWIIVFGHHPFESVPKPNGLKEERRIRREHGLTFDDLDQKGVWKKKMKPILELLVEHNNVVSYISGHHHIWRVCSMYDEDGHIRLLTTVTGSAGRDDFEFNEKLPPHMLDGGSDVSFGKFTVSKDELKVEIIDKTDHVLFTELIRARHRVEEK